MDDPRSADAGDAVDALLSLEDLARAVGLHPGQVESFVQFGLLEPAGGGGEMFSLAAVDRLRTIVRLRRDLGVNLAGVAAILEMRDHMADLQRELTRLRRLLGLEG